MELNDSPLNQSVGSHRSWRSAWYRAIARSVFASVLLGHAYYTFDMLQIAFETSGSWRFDHASKLGQGPVIMTVLLLIPVLALLLNKLEKKRNTYSSMGSFRGFITASTWSLFFATWWSTSTFFVHSHSVWYLAFGLAGAVTQAAIWIRYWSWVFGKKSDLV